MKERDEVHTPPSLCEFYDKDGGRCQYIDKYPKTVLPSLARVRRPEVPGNRTYVCTGRFSFDPERFQRNCKVTLDLV